MFQLLGRVGFGTGTDRIDAGPPLQRCVLAALLVDAGRPVTTESLVDRVWGERPPDRARRNLHVYVTRIRRLLREVPAGEQPPDLISDSGGYRLDLDADRVDLHRFRRVVAESRQATGDPDRRLRLLRTGMALWHGQPLAGLGGAWAERQRRSWQHEHVEAVTSWAEAEIEAGNGASVVGRLVEVADEHPLVESLAAALMRALHAAGRTADAIEYYTRTRERLAEELGTDPGTALVAAHRAILRGTVDPPDPPAMQVPPDLLSFVGREEYLRRLDRLLEPPDGPAATVVAVSGTAGVGKTTLAIHWAHRVRAHFPDGQLYANLRGFDPGGSPADPSEVLGDFLAALGVPPRQIPEKPDAQTALYRSRLAGRRMLVILDNAYGTEQVRRLLPAARGCVALVTSRNQLTGLIAADGARHLALGLMPAPEAGALLAARLTDRRVGAEPDAVRAIVEACARLPLALAIAAARAVTEGGTPLSAIADDLGGGACLDALTTDDPTVDIRAAFSWTYRGLAPGAQRLFRLIALHPGPDVSAAAAVSLDGTSADRTRGALTELVRANLIGTPVPGRYSVHDLLRRYGRELSGRCDGEEDVRAAVARIADHYIHSAHNANLVLYPHRPNTRLRPAAPGVVPVSMEHAAMALSWFAAERRAMVGVTETAQRYRLPVRAWLLASRLGTFLDLRGYWQDWVATQRIALVAAQHETDPVFRAVRTALSRISLGEAELRRGRPRSARKHLRRALALSRPLPNKAIEADAHLGLSQCFPEAEAQHGALRHAERALRLYRVAGAPIGEGRTINAIGCLYRWGGNPRTALPYHEQAVAIFQRLGYDRGLAGALYDLGKTHQRLGRYDDAMAACRRALATFDGTFMQARIRLTLGDLLSAVDDPAAARTHWCEALRALEELGHPAASTARRRLAARHGPR